MSGEEPKGTLIGFRGDRFGGRIAALLTVMRASDISGVPFRFCWPRTEAWQEMAYPEQIFSQEFMEAHFIEREVFERIRWQAKGFYPARYSEAEFKDDIAKGKNYLCVDTRARGFPWEDLAKVRAEIPSYVHQIGFSDTVNSLIARVHEAFDGAPSTIAYHVRRGDLIDDDGTNSHRLYSGEKYVPDAIYASHIEQTLEAEPEARIVIFSDEPRVIEALKVRFPQVMGVADITGEMEQTLAQRDFMELYTMSRCERIVGPPTSVFSAAAAMLGNGKVVSITDDLTPERREAALEDIAHAVETAPEIFLSQGDLGQCLPYYLQHRDNHGKADQASETLQRLLANGFTKSHIFPTMAERFFNAGRFDWLDELRAATAQGMRLHELASSVFGLSSLSKLLRDAPEEATQDFNAAFWLSPLEILRANGRSVDDAAMALLRIGHLGPESFPPFDHNAVWERRNSAKDGTTMARVGALGGGPVKQPVLSLEVVARDWMALGKRRIYPSGFIVRFKKPDVVQQRMDNIAQRLSGPDAPETLAMQSVFHRDLGAVDVARDLIERAMADAPDNPLYLKRRAELYFDAEEVEQGLDVLERATELSNGNIWYRAHFTWRTLMFGDPKEGRKMIIGLSEIDHPFPSIRQLVVRYLFRRPNFKERALAEIDKALAQVPGAPELVLQRGRVLAELDRVQEAREAYEYAMLSEEQMRPAAEALKVLEGA